MYKTVRHGENSLQYTILPQNDDFRMDSKLSSAESSCSSVSLKRKHKSKRQRRRSFFAYLGLIFICTVIVGAIVLPFLVSTECLPNPTEWFLKSKAALLRHTAHKNIDDIVENSPTILSTTVNFPRSSSHQENVGKQVEIINKNGVEKIILHVNKTNNMNNETQILLIETTTMASTNAVTQHEEISANIKNNQNPNMQIENTKKQQIQEQQFSTTIVNSPHSPASQQQQQQQQQHQQLQAQQTPQLLNIIPTITTRIIQVPLLKSTAKKPIIPPVLVKSKSIYEMQETPKNPKILETNVIVDNKMKDKDWLQGHWPYIDPTSYVQWMGYKTEDSVLLPAILGCALIVIILIIAICLLARNKRSLTSLVKKRNRHDIEGSSAEDNATLLTSTNMSDED